MRVGFTIICILFLFVFACSTTTLPVLSPETNKCKIYDSIELGSYKLYRCTTGKDTLAVLWKKAMVCKPDRVIRINPNSRQIKRLIRDSDTIFFYHYAKTVGKDMHIKSADGPPGKKNTFVYTHKTFPYLIEECL